MSSAFTPFPKIPRLYKDIVITEKIDGTNGAVRVVYAPNGVDEPGGVPVGDEYVVYAQSRNRDITPDDDNVGFAAWVYEHALNLAVTLGPGIHFGEWWGWKINRGYELEKGDRRFSLFNTARWGHFNDSEQAPNVPGLGVVPTLYSGDFSDFAVEIACDVLKKKGSQAAPGYMNPEGIVVYHTAANALFKVPFGKKAPLAAVA